MPRSKKWTEKKKEKKLWQKLLPTFLTWLMNKSTTSDQIDTFMRSKYMKPADETIDIYAIYHVIFQTAPREVLVSAVENDGGDIEYLKMRVAAWFCSLHAVPILPTHRSFALGKQETRSDELREILRRCYLWERVFNVLPLPRSPNSTKKFVNKLWGWVQHMGPSADLWFTQWIDELR